MESDNIQIQLTNGSNQVIINITGTTQQELIEKYKNIKENVLPDWIRG